MTPGATWSGDLTRRRFLRMAGAAGVAVTGATLSGSLLTSCSSGGDSLKVGVIAPFTGSGAFLGTVVNNSLNAAVKKLNADGGLEGRKLEVLLRDSGDDSNSASRLYDELSGQAGLVGLLWGGALGFEQVLPRIRDDGLPVVAVFGDPYSAELLPPLSQAAGRSVFQTAVPDDFAMTALAQYASKDRGYNTAALLYDVGADQEGAKPARFERTFGGAGLTVVGGEPFAAGDSPTEQLLRLQQLAPQVLYVDATPTDLGAVTKALAKLGASYVDTPTAKTLPWRPHVFAGSPGGSDQSWLVEAGGSVIPGTVSAGHLGGLIARPEFAVGGWMRQFLGKEPTGGEESPANGLVAIINAVKEAGSSDRDGLVRSMEKMAPTAFASLPFSFAQDRHVAVTPDEMVILTVERLRGAEPTDPPYQLGSEWQGGFFTSAAAGLTLLVRPTLEANRRAQPELMGEVLGQGFGTQCTKGPDGTLSPECKIH